MCQHSQVIFRDWSAQRHSFDVAEAAAKETLTDAVEAQRDVADAITVAGGLAVVMTQQVGSGERLRGTCGGGRGGINQGKMRRFTAQQRFEQRVQPRTRVSASSARMGFRYSRTVRRVTS